MRCIRMQAVPPRHLANDPGVPPRGFDQYVAGLLGNHCVESAHHASQGDWFARVGDDEILAGQLAFNPVERFQGFAILGIAHDNLAAFEQIEIEDVSWLAHLPQCVVSSIDRIVNRPLVEHCQPTCDSFWGKLHHNVAQHSRSEPRAHFSFRNFNRKWRGHSGRGGHDISRVAHSTQRNGFSRWGWRQLRLNPLQSQVVNNRSFSGHAVMVHGIRTIRANLHLEDGVLPFAIYALHRNSDRSKILCQAVIVHLGIDEFAQPCG